MKTKLKLSDFFAYTGIQYDDDIFCSGIECEYEDISNTEIIARLPAHFKLIEQDLEKYPEIRKSLNDALNIANRDTLGNEYISEQDKMVERVANEIVEYVNQLQDEYGKDLTALNSITIDWAKEIAIVDFNAKDALSAIREIVNGEGVFYYETDKLFAESYDGKKNVAQTVIEHLHYLLNIKLINSIYGLTHHPDMTWEVSGCTTDKHIDKEQIEEYLTPLQLNFATGKLHPDIFKAIDLRKQIAAIESKQKTLRKELYLIRQQITSKDQQLYVDTIE